MRAVNLLPADARVSTRPFASLGGNLSARRIVQVGGTVTVVLAALFVFLFIQERSTVHHKKSELATDQARLVAVQAQVDAIRSAQAAAEARFNAVKTVIQDRMNWDRTLQDLARILPADVRLNSLQAAAPITAAGASAATIDSASPPSATPSQLTITGVAPSYVRIAATLDRLALVPWLSSVTLTSAARQADGTTNFGITASVAEVH